MCGAAARGRAGAERGARGGVGRRRPSARVWPPRSRAHARLPAAATMTRRPGRCLRRSRFRRIWKRRWARFWPMPPIAWMTPTARPVPAALTLATEMTGRTAWPAPAGPQAPGNSRAGSTRRVLRGSGAPCRHCRRWRRRKAAQLLAAFVQAPCCPRAGFGARGPAAGWRRWRRAADRARAWMGAGLQAGRSVALGWAGVPGQRAECRAQCGGLRAWGCWRGCATSGRRWR